MSRAAPPPPPRSDIPRNLSYIAGLYERAYYRSARPSLEMEESEGEEKEEESGEEEPGAPRSRSDTRGRDPKAAARKTPSQVGATARRRARSAPADRTRAEASTLRSCSPDTRKRVRFADSLGLELTDVRHFRQTDLPRVPAHVQAQLRRDSLRHFEPCQISLPLMQNSSLHLPSLEPTFTDPGLARDFLERVRAQRVCLESITVESFFISGRIRVLNLAFEKTVLVRYSADSWRTHQDTRATYVPEAQGLRPRPADLFSFRLPLPACPSHSGLLQFAIRYQVGPMEFWDNNEGKDYSLRWRERRPPSPPSPGDFENGWVHFI
ncbi:protein phosphatase 1 regulatory subunit 3E [Rhinatrema bivittatum]|uniref:protein phosphatase 1 regulatory subunit 3E n=1 Tax=Rhinatrema bivittatum TaxID=194408 RepID=UPI00112B8630|nr:protein phosphatase 1 regulatory subunit 3E [Rhinatrema bivittatum]